jgi:Tfp pilus assembly protein FimT
MSEKVKKAFAAHLSTAGFTLVEACTTLAFICILGGFAALNVSAILPGVNANEAMFQTMAQLRNAREAAMAQRRNVEVRFLENNRIQIARRNLPNGETILSDVRLSHGCEFMLFDDVPDSPDTFGNLSAIDFGSATTLLFLSNGTLVDNASNPLSGSVFLGLPDRPETARAVTILGATGRVRSYRWNGNSWTQ